MKKLRSRSFRPSIESLEDRMVPATFFVNTVADVVNPFDGKLSLREAITAANALPGPDTIRLPAGIYQITQTGTPDNTNLSGDFDVFLNSTATQRDSLTIVGAGKDATTILGDSRLAHPGPNTLGRDRLFDVLGQGDVAFGSLTMRSAGFVNDSNQGTNGGAVQALTANVTLSDCLVTDMRGLQGGAINAGSGNVLLVRTGLIRNSAFSDGGAVHATSGAVTINRGSELSDNITDEGSGGAVSSGTGTVGVFDSTLFHNFATFGGGAISETSGVVALNHSRVIANVAGQAGGGVVNGNGPVTVTRGSLFQDNQATFGGGLFVVGTATLIDSTVNDNFATITGGGIDANAVTLTRSTVSSNTSSGNGGGLTVGSATLTDSTVSGNVAGTEGGGMLALGGAKLSRSTVDNNTAGTDGGGIKAFTVNLVNSTISTNHAHIGGGVFVTQGGDIASSTIAFNTADFAAGVRVVTGPVRVKNTIIAKNRINASVPIDQDVFGSFTSLGHNLIGNPTGGNANGTFSSAKGDLLFVDPRLGGLADNGGLTKTHALLAGSLAIDHGDNAGAPATDQRGVARPRDGDGNGTLVVDIGAFER